MAIKSFPLNFTEEELQRIEKSAKKAGIKSKKEFILNAINEKIKKIEKSER